MTEQLLSQLTASAIVVYFLQTLKKSPWCPWVTMETKRINRLLSAVGAAVTALGVHFSFDVQTGQAVITGLTLSNLLHGAWDWANQFALNQLVFDGVVTKRKE